MQNRTRGIMIVAGLILLAIGAIIILYPGLAVLIIVYLVAFGLIVTGLERLVLGILG